MVRALTAFGPPEYPSMIHPRPRVVLAIAVLLSLLSGASAVKAQDAIDATTGTDVCPANADPCVVSGPVQVAPSTILDFGTRAVSLVGKGAFEFAGGTSRIRCGSFDADTDGPAVRSYIPAGTTPPDSRNVYIEARRRCDGGDAQLPCLSDENCQLGACDTRHCSGNPVKTCAVDAGCQIGPCSTVSRRCLNSLTVVRCTTNADCNLGTCPVQTTCNDLTQSGAATNCSIDSDCALGACTLGDGNVDLGGGVAGSGRPPMRLTLRAAASATITAPVHLRGRGAEENGGDLTVSAYNGDVILAARVNARSGKLSQGGDIFLDASRDIAVEERIAAQGGDFDGGRVVVEAGRDIHIGASLLLNSRSGAGYGGIVAGDAGRDITIDGGPDRDRIRIELNGHRNGEGFPGDGGDFDIIADGNFTMAEEVRVSVDGAPMGGYGGFAYVETGGDLAMHGDLQARGRGSREAGSGMIDFYAEGSIHIGPESVIETAGDDSDVGLWAEGDQLMEGIDLDACRIALAPGSLLENRGSNSRTRLISHESMTLLAGSTIDTVGTDSFTYRADTKPPVVQGDVSPAPQLVHNPLLVGCPVCGNSEIDQDETCDDGNTTPGDGCSEVCLVE